MKNKNYICYVPYLRNSVAYDHDFWYTCVKWWYLQEFFSVFQSFVFLVVRGRKGQKMFQNDKKFRPSCFISQESYIIWSWFLAHLCKMMISPGSFFSFSKFWFCELLESKRVKNVPKWQKILSVKLYISGTIHHVTVIFGSVKW